MIDITIEEIKAAVREAVAPICEERDRLRARVAELERLQVNPRAEQVVKLQDDVASLLQYIDDAKLALGDTRVSGEPLADTIRRLRQEIIDTREDLADHRTALNELVADGRGE